VSGMKAEIVCPRCRSKMICHIYFKTVEEAEVSYECINRHCGYTVIVDPKTSKTYSFQKLNKGGKINIIS